jgi:hypothetical protein
LISLFQQGDLACLLSVGLAPCAPVKIPPIPAVPGLLTFLFLCGALTGQSPAQAQTPAAKRSEWRDYIRTFEYGQGSRNSTGRSMPPGPSLMPEVIKELQPGDLTNPWKMTDGVMREFEFVSWTFPFDDRTGNPVRLHLTIKVKPGGETKNMPVASLHPDEFRRVQRIMWYRYYEYQKNVVVPPKAPPPPAAERTVFHFYGSGLEKLVYGDFANRPPGPLVAEAAVADLPVWPAMEKWKLKDGREVQFSLYGWHWISRGGPGSNTSPEAELEILPAGAAACTALPALDLDVAERDRLLRALWRRHYRALTLSKYRHPSNPASGCHENEGVSDLTKKNYVSVLVPVPSLPLPGCKLMPPPAVIPPRSDVSDANVNAPPGKFERERFSNSVAAWLLWWDQAGWLPLDHKGNANEKRQWLLDELSRDMPKTGDAVLDWGLAKRLSEFSIEHLDGKYDFQFVRDLDYSPANQARLAAGNNGTIVQCMIYSGPFEHRRCCMPLISASPDGKATLSLWGLHLDGKWTPCDRPHKKRDDPGSPYPPVYEFIMDDKIKDALPGEFKRNRYRIILGAGWYFDGIQLLIPQRCGTPLKEKAKGKH